MIDMHSHVLWGLDDGSQSLAMSQQMLKIAWEHNTRAMVFTPHVIEERYKPSWNIIKGKTEQLQMYLRQELPDMVVYSGAEVQMNWNLLPEIAVDGAYCINGGKYILIELPMEEIPIYADNFWYELELKGLHPILAHPERYLRLMRHKRILYKWRERGILLQCNAGSFTGKFGERVRQNAEFLLKADMVDFLGSDAHRDNIRTPDLSQAAQIISSIVGNEKLQQIAVNNPQLLLENKQIVVNIPQREVEQNKKSFWQKIWSKIV